MSISLSKGQKVSLTKNSGADLFVIGLGWDPADGTSQKFDLDASAFVCKQGLAPDTNGQQVMKAILVDDPNPDTTFFVFYNNTTTPDGALIHTGDNRTGGGDGDDEQIMIDFRKLTKEADEIAFIVSIDEYEARKQNFGQVRNAYIRVCEGVRNADGTPKMIEALDEKGAKVLKPVMGPEVMKYDLSEDYSSESALQFGSLYTKDHAEWKFNAVGKGFNGYGLADFVHYYGPHVSIKEEQ